MEGDADREEDADQHADVEQAEPLDLERRHVLGAGGGDEIGAQRLQRLALVLDALGEAAGQRRRLHDGNDLARALLPERADHRGDRALVADELRGEHEQRGVVAVEPVLLAAGVGRAEVVERDLAVVGHQNAQPVEVAVCDPGVVQAVELLPRRRQDLVGDALGRRARRAGCRRAEW